MKHVSELLDQELGRLAIDNEREDEARRADPYTFDVACQRCGHVFDTREPWCPQCEDMRAEELPIGW